VCICANNVQSMLENGLYLVIKQLKVDEITNRLAIIDQNKSIEAVEQVTKLKRKYQAAIHLNKLQIFDKYFETVRKLQIFFYWGNSNENVI